MESNSNKTSNAAVQKATGKTWEEWIKIIDEEGGAQMSHKEIARMLFDKKYIESGWWCQQVTVGYEYAKGRRTLGETAAAGFEIGVSKTYSLTAAALWDFMFSKKGIKIWLGEVKNFKLQKGFVYTTNKGITGEVRTLDYGKRIRMTRRKGNGASSTLQLYFTAKGKRSSLIIHQEKLLNAKQREAMKEHWKKVAAEIEKNIS